MTLDDLMDQAPSHQQHDTTNTMTSVYLPEEEQEPKYVSHYDTKEVE